MTAHDAELNAATRASAAAIGRNRRTWAQWGPRRRRLIALVVGNWVALGVVVAITAALREAAVILAALPLIAVNFWLGRRLLDAEEAEGAFEPGGSFTLTQAEHELSDRLEAADEDGERRGDALLLGEVLVGTAVARRYEYPTRELLILRTASEAIELVGLATILAFAPDGTTGMAVGCVLLVLGGRSGAGVIRAVFGQHLYGSPVDDVTRQRWLGREGRITAAALVTLVAAAVLKDFVL